MTYQELRDMARKENIEICESCDIGRLKGLYFDNTILLSEDINTYHEKKCILCEELGHHYLTCGNILDQKQHLNKVQEMKARRWAYQKLVTIEKLINAYHDGVQSIYELAEYLRVTTDFLKKAIKFYKKRYGPYHKHRNYKIQFEPLKVTERG